MKKEYSFVAFNEFLNTQATPQEIARRLSRVAMNYARTTNEFILDDMRHDLDFLQLMIDCFELLTPMNGKEETL